MKDEMMDEMMPPKSRKKDPAEREYARMLGRKVDQSALAEMRRIKREQEERDIAASGGYDWETPAIPFSKLK